MTTFDWESARQKLERTRLAIEGAALSTVGSEDLYRRRAALLAQLPGGVETAAAEILVFRLGMDRYALPVQNLIEVSQQPRLACVPKMPSEVAGLLQVRGEVYVVWDLHRLLGGFGLESRAARNVLLLRSPGHRYGFLVEEIEDVRIVEDRERQPVARQVPHAAWTTKDFVTVLDAGTLLHQATGENAKI